MEKKQILGASKCGHFVIFSCECFCNPCEYMRSLSARWESQKKRGCRIALSLSYFPLFTAFCLSDGDENIGSGGQTTGPDTFSPPPLSFTFSLSFISSKKFRVAANKCSIAKLLYKAGNKDTKSYHEIILKIRLYKIACVGIRETMSLRHATVLNHWTLEGFLQNHHL